MQKKLWKQILPVAAVLIAFAGLFALLNLLLQPKYMDDLVEGSMLSQYYEEYGGHDVIFIGDCEVYANFTPMEMYRSAGVTSYVRGSPQQLIWQSYYVLQETLRYEIPKTVVFNVNAMRYSEPVSEAFNRLTLDKMRWSREKVSMIRASMTPKEQFLSYVFPILRYHARFDELTREDFIYLFARKQTAFGGHLVNQEIKPVGTLPAKRPLTDSRFGDICWDYLDRIRSLCEAHGIELILIKAPSLYPHWYEEYEDQIRGYAQEHGLAYYNLLEHQDQIGLDFSVDTYDAGLHLNLTGATKLSVWFADVLRENHGLADHRKDPEIAERYAQQLRAYDEYIEE